MEDIRKGQVIEAAKKCIVDKGLSNLSMKDIAKEAEVSTGIIYHYFKNKEDVLLQVLKESFRSSHEQVMETVEPLETPEEKLTKHLENINSVPKENPDFYLLLMNYLGEAKHHPEIKKIVVKFFRNLKTYIEEYLGKDLKSDARMKHLPIMIYALGLGLGIMWTMDNQFYDIEEMETSIKDLIFSYVNLEKGR
ncbi:TetR family transcriptional regulator [Pueribacillus theae]|uniref:TetR family transcriptional regulator n=2 Tax=Pueribacillus theae TaxID=2171751 RepID=A0A2U1JYX4_9BACI|nr:TetR family transcriptional regulator [Pueribacillus theae]